VTLVSPPALANIPLPRSFGDDALMARNLLQLLSPKCTHEFGWPRKAADGEYYQVCVNCGAEYQYDWPSMRRLGKRPKATQQSMAAPVNESVTRKRSWSPRAPRLQTPIAVQLRPLGEIDYRTGTIGNISQSGLFVTSEYYPANQTVLEMIFEMPIEISGQRNSKVLCVGRVVRVATQSESNTVQGFAVSMVDYHFLHEQERRPTQVMRRSQKTPVLQ